MIESNYNTIDNDRPQDHYNILYMEGEHISVEPDERTYDDIL